MRPPTNFRYLGFATLTALVTLALPLAVRATDLSVDCASGGSLQAAIDSLDVIGPHTITITGTCEENVQISGRDRLTLQGGAIDPPGGPGLRIENAHTINLSGLTITGAGTGVIITGASSVSMDGCTVDSNVRGIQLFEDSHLNLSSSTVRNHAGIGINAENSSLRFLGAVTVENNGGIGMRLSTGSSALLDGFDLASGNTIQNNGQGVLVGYASSIRLNGKNDILNNGFTGINLQMGSGALLAAIGAADGEPALEITISGHLSRGLGLTFSSGAFLDGPVHISGNGGSGEPDDAGIYLQQGSSLLLQRGPVVTGNSGAGVLADGTGSIFLTGSTVSNNTAGGVRVIRQSTVHFNTATGFVNTASGNGGADVSCDTTSLVSGDLSGVSTVSCTRVERVLGPPRPGRIM